MATTNIKVDGMSCAGCVRKLIRRFGGQPGVTGIRVDRKAGLAQVKFNENEVGHDALLKVVQEAGFKGQIPETAPAA
ncbi:MAG: heavy-metal-associated domain-containing protein [Zoogloeaceae bacterium]|jgi:copper chaperone CopZ|nr:heavy-metal-associated domain-containing protein [Zoogloeaceae bacterium]